MTTVLLPDHTLSICKGGTFCQIDDMGAISDHLADPESLVWLDIRSPGAEELAILRDEFRFHPLAIEDALHHQERPKIEAFDRYYLIIFYAAEYNDGDEEVRLDRMSLFVGQNYLVSIHSRAIPEIEQTIARWHTPNSPLENRISGLLHALLDAIVDDYFLVMDRLVDRVEDLEDSIFDGRRKANVQEIFALKKTLLLLRRVASPERDVINVLLRRELPIFGSGELIYVQDVYDHLIRVTDQIDNLRELVGNAMESYLSIQSHRLNEIVKVLTITSIILMACALIAGIYGMNFTFMPELSWPWGYPFALALMAGVAVGLGAYFRSRKWW